MKREHPPTGTPAKSHANTSDFVKTHCRTCAAGQTITRDNGRQATYCLLLREWMTGPEGQGTITACDRYENKDAIPAAAAE